MPKEDQTCGTCWYWKGDELDFLEYKRLCLCPWKEGHTFISFVGYSKAEESCTRYKPDIEKDL